MRVDIRTMSLHLLGCFSVFLNGEKINLCTMADDFFGIVKVYKEDDNGNLMLNESRDELLQEHKRGHVVICDHWKMEGKRIYEN